MKNEDFKLNDDDAAIVISKDLSAQMFLPDYGDDVEIGFEEYQNYYIIMAIMMSLSDPEFRNVINGKLNTIFTQASNMAKDDNCDPTGCPGCGGGGCSV